MAGVQYLFNALTDLPPQKSVIGSFLDAAGPKIFSKYFPLVAERRHDMGGK